MNNNYRSGGLPGELQANSTLHMVRSRTVEMAISAGRGPVEIRQCDYEQAKRELTGETDFERQRAVLYPGCNEMWRTK